MPTTRVLVKAANKYKIFSRNVTTIDLYVDFKEHNNPIIKIADILGIEAPSTCIG